MPSAQIAVRRLFSTVPPVPSPEAGLDVLAPDVVGDPVGAGRVHGPAAAVDRGAAGGVRVEVEVLDDARRQLEQRGQADVVRQRDGTVDRAVPDAGARDRDALGAQAGRSLEVERARREPQDLFCVWAWLMQFWMAAVLSTAALSALPFVGVLSATAPQLVMEMELAGWAIGGGGFSTSTTSM